MMNFCSQTLQLFPYLRSSWHYIPQQQQVPMGNSSRVCHSGTDMLSTISSHHRDDDDGGGSYLVELVVREIVPIGRDYVPSQLSRGLNLSGHLGTVLKSPIKYSSMLHHLQLYFDCYYLLLCHYCPCYL